MSYRPSRTAASYQDIADDDRSSHRGDRGDGRRDDRYDSDRRGPGPVSGGRGGGYGGGGYGAPRDGGYRERDSRDYGDRRGADQRESSYGQGRGDRHERERESRDARDARDGNRRRSRSRSPRRRDDRDRDDRDRRRDPAPRDNQPPPPPRHQSREPVPGRPHPEQISPRVPEPRGAGGWDGERAVPPPREDRDRSISAPLSTADDAADIDAAAMAAMMGFSGFDTTKAKHVQDDLVAVAIKQPRTHRQYMNRPGGFNRPLDKIK